MRWFSNPLRPFKPLRSLKPWRRAGVGGSREGPAEIASLQHPSEIATPKGAGSGTARISSVLEKEVQELDDSLALENRFSSLGTLAAFYTAGYQLVPIRASMLLIRVRYAAVRPVWSAAVAG